MKRISDNGSVSLIGESWGGVVALKMAQMLEAQGTLVTVSLLNGDPKTVSGWAESFLSQDCYANRLNTVHDHSEKVKRYTGYGVSKIKITNVCIYHRPTTATDKTFFALVGKLVIRINHA